MKNKTKVLLVIAAIFIYLIPLVLYKTERDKNKGLKVENKILNSNIAALNDSVRVTKTKNGQLEYDKRTLITTVGDLTNLSKDLSVELEKTKGKVILLQKSSVKIHTVDTILGHIDPVHSNPDSCDFVVGLDKTQVFSPGNYKKTQGYVKVNKDTSYAIIEDSIGLTAVTGLKKNQKGDYEIFFRSDYPGLVVTDLKGAYIPKNQLNPPVKKKRLSLGVSIGYTPVTYNLQLKALEFGHRVYFGVGVNYKLF